ncbi:MAG: hypothetical protein D6772_04980 [Bacteroidetes bacterium]|nr:MAG: hypothetical protein D6772_04980 [Bacteroidota bacterium]
MRKAKNVGHAPARRTEKLVSAQSSQGARARQAGRLSEAFQRSEEDKEQAKSEERSDDQRKLKITNLALEDDKCQGLKS